MSPALVSFCVLAVGLARFVSAGGCLAGEFVCTDGAGCIPSIWHCDFWRDCRDASDEALCPCGKDETRCPSSSGGGRCIPVSWLCDGWVDCEDGWSDEQGCEPRSEGDGEASLGIVTAAADESGCLDDAVTCPNGRCIRPSWVCDGDNDCLDMWDEANCTRDWSQSHVTNSAVHVTGNGPQSAEQTTTASDVTQSGLHHSDSIIVSVNATEPKSVTYGDELSISDVTKPNVTDVIHADEQTVTSDVTTDQDELRSPSTLPDAIEASTHGEFSTSAPYDECSWTAWSEWSACPAACFARRQTRSRECLCPEGGESFVDYNGCGTAPPDEVRTCALEGCLQEADSGCGTRSPQEPVQRIVNGDTAAVGGWPWQVQLRYQGSFICGGTLVGRRHVVTAAHCFNAFSGAEIASRWTVFLGKHTLTRTVAAGQHKSSVAQLIVHAAHDDDANTNDIAIMVLADPLPEGSLGGPLINAACLDVSGALTLGGSSNCFITGWGYLSYKGVVSYELQEASVPLIPNAVCSSSLVYGDKITDDMQCAGYLEGDIDSCTGDSGGPLVCSAQDVNSALSRWYLVGIISWGKRCADENRPGVYTNVSRYMDWIVNKTAAEFD